MKKKRILLGIAVVLMAVGFAAVSTTLFINGTTNVATKEDDFDVYFSDAYIDGWQDLTTISEDKKTISYETKALSIKGENSTLDYEVVNASKQYDAKVNVNCVPVEDEWIKVEASQTNEIIEARSKGTGKIKVTLKATALEEKRIEFKCTLNVSAIERENINENEISPVEIQKAEWEFGYVKEGENKEQEFIVPRTGTYKLEVWGAQGGNGNTVQGGYGAYSIGYSELEKGQKLYVNVGGQGESTTTYAGNLIQKGGYNGGGDGNNGACTHSEGGGGGATHIALSSGTLTTLENKIEDILIVAGGGGGGHGHAVSSSYESIGGSGGGMESTGDIPATQTSGYKFGQGFESTGCAAGGGGGFYGGNQGGNNKATGGGSGYIGNPLLTHKVMVCYNCTNSDDESTKTRSTLSYFAEAKSHYTKAGNGYARITYMDEIPNDNDDYEYAVDLHNFPYTGNVDHITYNDDGSITLTADDGWNDKVVYLDNLPLADYNHISFSFSFSPGYCWEIYYDNRNLYIDGVEHNASAIAKNTRTYAIRKDIDLNRLTFRAGSMSGKLTIYSIVLIK